MHAPITIEQLSEAAVMHDVADGPPLPQPTGAPGIMRYTDQGYGLIVAPDASVREQLVLTLQAYRDLSVREIGDVDIDFGSYPAHHYGHGGPHAGIGHPNS